MFKVKLKNYIFLTIILLIINIVSADIIFNEIMYDPSTAQGHDNYNEWIEIYNNNENETNLTNWKLCGKELLPGYVNRTENILLNAGIILKPHGYAIITDGGSGTEAYDNFDINPNSIALHIGASSMCSNGLSKSEKITLSSETETIDILRYNSTWGGKGNGFSICLFPNAIGTWKECSITPGQENSQTSSQI